MRLNQFIGQKQLQAIQHTCKSDEGKFFQEMLFSLKQKFATMPKTHETDGQGEKAIVHLHYFNGGSDWWITERDQENEQLQAFGFACLNGDKEFAELGYISITELIENDVELDLYWTPKSLSEIESELGL